MMSKQPEWVSIDEVSKRSGVAKTTIYRHWPSRADLLLEACSKLGSKFEVPDTGSFRGDVEALVLAFASYLRQHRRRKFFLQSSMPPNMTPRLPSYSTLRCMLSSWLPLRGHRTAQKKGEIGRDQDALSSLRALSSAVLSALVFGESLDQNFVRAIVQSAIAPRMPIPPPLKAHSV